MPRIIPSLFQLVGAGFRDDDYAADGNHLRWQFDPRLGFPRLPFCLERRPAVGTKHGGRNNLPRESDAFIALDPARENRLVRPGYALQRVDRGVFQRGDMGLVLSGTPFEIDFHGGSAPIADPYACFVRLAVRLQVPGGRIEVEGLYDDQGEPEVVDTDSASQGRRIFRPPIFERIPDFAGGIPDRLRDSIAPGLFETIRETDRVVGSRGGSEPEEVAEARRLLAEPQRIRSRPRLRSPREKRVYRDLVRHDRSFRNVSATWVRRLTGLLGNAEVDLSRILRPATTWKTHFLELRASRIDRVRISGTRAVVVGMEWVRTEALMNQRDWERVQCIPIATGEETYQRWNGRFFTAAETWQGEAESRVMDPMPNGAEPLDDPQVPPSRPPTAEERRCRYLEPWTRQLEPWVRTVLAESLGGGLHMSEVVIEEQVDEFGQAPGDGGPPEDLEDQTLATEPYGMLLASAQAFTTARLLGLATVDRPDPESGLWDYRVAGYWDGRDIVAWAGRLIRETAEISKELNPPDGEEEPTPARRAELEAELLASASELWATILFLVPLVSGATNGVVDLWALKLGVSQNQRPLFDAPDALTAEFHELGRTSTPDDPGAVSRLAWTLRDRATFRDLEQVPMLATLARMTAGGAEPFEEVLNPVHPATREAAGCDTPQGVIPQDPDPGAGTPDDAEFLDRGVEDGARYTYGVSEADPFGRWSPFTTTPFQWDYDVPPSPPAGVEAELVEEDDELVLVARFNWNPREGDPDDMGFALGLRHTPPPGFPDDPATGRAPGAWSRLGRTPGSAAGEWWFGGDGTGGSATHDGMDISVAFEDLSEHVIWARSLEGDDTLQAGDPIEPVGEGADRIDAVPTGGEVLRQYTVRVEGLQPDRDLRRIAKVWIGIRTRDRRNRESSVVAGPAVAEHVETIPPPPVAVPPEPLEATYADAQGLSSFTLDWSGEADTQYVVYRAGERDLTRLPEGESQASWASTLSAAGYEADGPDNERAAALKALAADRREVFVPVSEREPAAVAAGGVPDYGGVPDPTPIAAGDRTHIDTLPGSLRTLTLYTVLGISTSGAEGAWPDPPGFAAVRIPRAPEPTRPVVIRGVWREGLTDPSIPPALAGHGVELHIARPPKNDEEDDAEPVPVAAYEVYRTTSRTRARSVRTMRLLHRLDAPTWSVPGGGEGVPVAVYSDPTAAGWTRYFYRVVARYDGDGRPGMRSEASGPVRVDTRHVDPPAPPHGVSASRPTPDDLVIEFRSDAPDPPAGRFRWEVRNRATDAIPVAGRGRLKDARQGATDQFDVSVPGEAVAPGEAFVVRVIDPAGRWSESSEVSAP